MHKLPGRFRMMTALVAAVLAVNQAARADDADGELLRATQEALRSVATSVRPYLVRIETVGGSQPPGRILGAPGDRDSPDGSPRPAPNRFRDAPGSEFVIADGPTTGIVYSSDGYLIASSFNFVREPLLISATLADGRRLAAKLIARDQVRKIALLKVNATGLEVPPWRMLDDVRIGEWAVALGLGFGSERPSVTAGIISAVGRMHNNAVQTDAKLSPANYGGPLCDIFGRIIGICVPMAQRPGELAGVEMYDSGVGFAVGKKRVDEIVSVLKTGRSFYRGWLGISVERAGHEGVVIKNVADPSPMLKAGIEPGDRILWAQHRNVHQFRDLVGAIYMIPAGEPVYLHVAREARELTRTSPTGGVWHAYNRRFGPAHSEGDLARAETSHPVQAGPRRIEFCITVTLARNTELGPLSDDEDPPDPVDSFPMPTPHRGP